MVKDNPGDIRMRLEMHGFRLFDEKKENFGFQIHDISDPSKILIDTFN
jgi:hypothetical protein